MKQLEVGMNTLSRFFKGELGIKQLPTVVAACRDPVRRPFVIQALVVGFNVVLCYCLSNVLVLSLLTENVLCI